MQYPPPPPPPPPRPRTDYELALLAIRTPDVVFNQARDAYVQEAVEFINLAVKQAYKKDINAGVVTSSFSRANDVPELEEKIACVFRNKGWEVNFERPACSERVIYTITPITT